MKVIPFTKSDLARIARAKTLKELSDIAIEIIESHGEEVGHLGENFLFSKMTKEEEQNYVKSLNEVSESLGLVMFNHLPFSKRIEVLKKESKLDDFIILRNFFAPLMQRCSRIFFLPSYKTVRSVKDRFGVAKTLKLMVIEMPSDWQRIVKKSA